MRLHPVWGLILFFLAALATTSLASGAELAGRAPDGYVRQDIEGFTVYVNKTVLQQPRDRWGRQPLIALERELNDLRRILIPKIFSVLQDVPIYVEWDERPNQKNNMVTIARYWHRNAGEGMRPYGADPARAGCIEVLTLRVLDELRHPGTALQQVVILHEMVHAVHDRLIGWDNPEVEATFQQAVDRKLYDEVNDRSGRRTRAYARTNSREYFAEISCAYLDSCNFYPFNHDELRGYDPAGYALVERVWKHPERFGALAKQPAARADKTTGPAAAMRVDKLRAQARSGQSEQAKQGLQDLVRAYSGTAAADDARQLLKTMN
jgi:hypothetical protein